MTHIKNQLVIIVGYTVPNNPKTGENHIIVTPGTISAKSVCLEAYTI